MKRREEIVEHWIQYKDNYINIGQAQNIRVEKQSFAKSTGQAVEARYWGDAKPTKDKPWVLVIGHEGVGVFANKEEAMKVAEKMIKGDYDVV